MKIKALLTILFVCLSFTLTYASFPVKRTVKATTEVTSDISSSDNVATTTLSTPAAAVAQKDLLVGVLLWFFLGGLAGHRWYYGKPVGWNILFILTAGGLGIWWIIDLINMLSDNF